MKRKIGNFENTLQFCCRMEGSTHFHMNKILIQTYISFNMYIHVNRSAYIQAN